MHSSIRVRARDSPHRHSSTSVAPPGQRVPRGRQRHAKFSHLAERLSRTTIAYGPAMIKWRFTHLPTHGRNWLPILLDIGRRSRRRSSRSRASEHPGCTCPKAKDSKSCGAFCEGQVPVTLPLSANAGTPLASRRRLPEALRKCRSWTTMSGPTWPSNSDQASV